MYIVWEASPKLTVARVVLTILQAALPLIPLYLFKLLVDALAETDGARSFDSILWILGGIALAQIASILLGTFAAYVNYWQNDVVADKMSRLVAEKSISMDFAYYDSNKFYDVFQRAQAQANSRPLAVLGTVIGLMKNILTLIGVGGLLMTLHWAIVLAIAVIALPVTYLRIKFSRELVTLTEQQTPDQRKAGLFKGMLTGAGFAKDLRIYGYGQAVKKQYLALLKYLREQRINLQLRQTYKIALVQGIEIFAVILGIAYVAYQAFENNISLGDVALYFGLFQKGQSEVKALFGSGVSLNEHTLFLRHLFQFFELEAKVADPANPLPMPQHFDRLSVENVSFQYPHTTKRVLDQVSFELKKGQILAIVGENGSGKTTLVKLISRLYDVSAGQIALNGHNIKAYGLRAYRAAISTLFQQFSRYDLPVKQNIQLADMRKPLDIAEIKEVSKLARANEFISDLPKKYDTQLGRSFWTGEELSGGQWQKIALARSLYKEADLLILDEPTSQIDPLAEEAIFRNMLALAKDKMMILVTHRIYNLTVADCILVMDKGRIIEKGTHQELIARQGKYHQMFASQEVV